MSNQLQTQTGISSLPWEIITTILHLAAEANIADGYTPKFTYGMSQTFQAMKSGNDVELHKQVSGELPPDQLRWRACDPLRQVCSRWHEWALGYSVRELYIRRWRGGESWDPKFLALQTRAGEKVLNTSPVVYQDPYRTLKVTASLVEKFPSLCTHIRKLWFSGINRCDNAPHIFSIIRKCTNLQTLTIPWTALRYGSVEDWIHITSLPRLTSLGLLAINMKKSEIPGTRSYCENNRVLEDPRVDFSKLRRLRIHGSSNVQSIVDADLWEIARTARNLRELHITGSSTISIYGVSALITSSRETLKVLDYSPLDPESSGSSHLYGSRLWPNQGPSRFHFCEILSACTNLTDVKVTVPHICEHLICPPPAYSENIIEYTAAPTSGISWRKNAIIRLPKEGCTCAHQDQPLRTPESVKELKALLNVIRQTAHDDEPSKVTTQLFVGQFLFYPATSSVAGNYKRAKKIAEGMWIPEDETRSRKGPAGSSGLWGDMEQGEWTEIPELDFWDAISVGLLRFE